jgi:hypothetical protein
MNDKVKTFLWIAACVVVYVVLIPFQAYRMGYNKGHEAEASEWAQYGYETAIDTVISILGTETGAGNDSTLTRIVFNDTIVYDLNFDPNKFSPKNDSITPNLK